MNLIYLAKFLVTRARCQTLGDQVGLDFDGNIQDLDRIQEAWSAVITSGAVVARNYLRRLVGWIEVDEKGAHLGGRP